MDRHLFRAHSPPGTLPNRGRTDCLADVSRLSYRRGSIHLLAHARPFSATSRATGRRFRAQGVACSDREGGVAFLHPGTPAGITGRSTGRPVDDFLELTTAISTLVFIDGHGCCPRSSRQKDVAERAGFEPALEFPLNTLSKRAPSATRPSLPVQLGPIVMKSGGGVQGDSNSESGAAKVSPRSVGRSLSPGSHGPASLTESGWDRPPRSSLPIRPSQAYRGVHPAPAADRPGSHPCGCTAGRAW